MNTRELMQVIDDQVRLAQNAKIMHKLLFSDDSINESIHEYLFFLKPEITIQSGAIRLPAILSMLFEKFEQHRFHIKDIRLLGSSYLEQYNIIAQHYGVINALSCEPLVNLSSEATEKFSSVFGKKPEDVNIVGSIEFLKLHPEYNAVTLDQLWKKSRTEKLAGGTYCALMKISGEDVYLINGFHPLQILHFTKKGRSIVTFRLTGNIDWATARNKFIGKTNPADALTGSLRNEILQRKKDFGLADVSSSLNGFHLSAGPVEGLVELIRYCSDYASRDMKTIDDFLFGRQLRNHFSNDEIVSICRNHVVSFKGKATSIFDLTEEKDSSDALQILKEVVF
jgi:hypothetical protein